jgi:hypothetical protein
MFHYYWARCRIGSKFHVCPFGKQHYNTALCGRVSLSLEAAKPGWEKGASSNCIRCEKILASKELESETSDEQKQTPPPMD